MGHSLLIKLDCTTNIDENFANDKFFSLLSDFSENHAVSDGRGAIPRDVTAYSALEIDALALESNLRAINNSIDFINQLFNKSST